MNTKLTTKFVAYSLCIALAMLAGSGCHHKKKAINPYTDTTSGSSTSNTGGNGGGLPNLDQSSLNFTKSDLPNVYFDYDSSAIRSDAAATLKGNAEKMKGAAGKVFQIAGHCDERGTQEYNLALGERRALAVREYLIKLGVSGDKMVTISYGEEMPAVQGHTEAAYAQNRRAEFNWATAH